MFAHRRPQYDGSTAREHPEIFARMGWGAEKNDFGVQKL